MNKEISNSSTALRVSEITGKGRGFVASQPLSAGEIILRDSPIVLYSALPFHLVSPAAPTFCHHCFRSLSSSSQVNCSECFNHHFCSATCLSSAVASSHSTWVCHSLRRLSESSTASIFSGHPSEHQIQARFLIAAYNLAAISPSRFQILLSLHGGGNSSSSLSSDDIVVANFLHSVLTSVCTPLPISVSPELTAALLAKDKLNAFGLMEPSEKRSVRAYGIYPMASFFNHDCLPNACRFDSVDTAAEGNTDIIVRMIHDVPEGREICLSYFPVNLNYVSRQNRMLEDYGFVCDCDRCKVEANWSDNEGGAVGEDGRNDEIMDDDDDDDDDNNDGEGDQEMDAEDEADMEGDESDFPHAYFFMRYMCEAENCWGTLAPLPPSDSCPSKILECNVCGNLKEDEVIGAN